MAMRFFELARHHSSQVAAVYKEIRRCQSMLLDEGVSQYLRIIFRALVAQVQMFSPLFDAEHLKPGRTIRHKLRSLHKRRSDSVRTAAGDLRGQRKKQFVHSFRRQKLSEECGPALVEQPSHPELRV